MEPYTLAMTIARAARRLGVTFETDRPVTAIQLERGAVRGVDTPAGPLQSPRVIVAAGPWVERVAGAVGLAVDTVPLRHQHWTTAPMAEVPANLPVVRVPDASVYIRPEVGGLMLGGFEARPKAFSMTELPLTFEIEHTEKDLGVLEELAGGLTRAFPALDGAPVLKGCAGLPTFTPDGNYLLGAVPTRARALGGGGVQRDRDRRVAPDRGVAERAGPGGADAGRHEQPGAGPVRPPLRRAPAAPGGVRVDLRQLLQPGQGSLLSAWRSLPPGDARPMAPAPGRPERPDVAQERFAKIVCTIGPASIAEGIIEQMARAGMDVARLNFSHGTHAEHLLAIERIRSVEARIGKPIAILQDLQGPKIRLGTLRRRRRRAAAARRRRSS